MEKEIYGIIYLIKNKINNKIYIGQTTQDGGFDRRYHTKDGIKDTHNEHLRNSINKYGIENFYINKEFDIAYSKEELDKLEDMYIKIYNTIDKNCGYNNRYGGTHGKMTEERKQLVEKLVIEEKDLYEKIIKLREFILHSETWDNLEIDEKYNLQRQLEAMTNYLTALEDRITYYLNETLK